MSDESYMESLLRRAAEPNAKPENEGYEFLTCKNHPGLRWEQRKYNPRLISNNPHLMFLGDTRGMLPGHELGAEYGDGVRTAIECPCPYSDLIPLPEFDQDAANLAKGEPPHDSGAYKQE